MLFEHLIIKLCWYCMSQTPGQVLSILLLSYLYGCSDGSVAQQVTVLTAKSEDLILIPKTQMVNGQNKLKSCPLVSRWA